MANTNPLNGTYETLSQKGQGTKKAVEEKIIAELNRRFEASRSNTSSWRQEARRAFNYYENSQVPPEVENYDDVLYITLNLVRPRIDTKVGILSAAKPRADLIGRGVEDVDVASAYKDLLEYSADEDKIDGTVLECISNLCKCGLGVIEEELDPDEPEGQLTSQGWVKGKLRATSVDPLRYYIDPRNRSRNMWGKYGPDWYFVESEESISELMMLYPAKARLLETLQKNPPTDLSEMSTPVDNDYEGVLEENIDDSDSLGENFTGYKDQDSTKVLTHWYIRRDSEELVYAYDADRRLVRAVDPTTGESIFPENLKLMDPELRKNFRTIQHISREVWTCAYTGDILLYIKKSPYRHNRWPAVFFCGVMHRDKPMPYGEVHNLFDAQDLYNKLNSVILDNAIRSNNTGWKLEDGAMDAKEEERLQNEGSSPGFIAKVRMGRADGLERLEPGQLPRGLWEIQRDVRQTFDELSSLYQTQRGGMPYETSGKAVIALQEAADMALTNLQRNIEDAITDWGRKRLLNIQQFYTYERAWRISSKTKEIDHHLITQLEQPIMANGLPDQDKDPNLALYKLQDGDPEPKKLVEDFTKPEFDLKFVMGSGHERSRQDKLKEAQFLFEAGAVDPSYLLQEFEVEGRSEITRRMEEKNPILQMGKQVMEMMEDKTMGPLINMVIKEPEKLLSMLESAGIDPNNPQAPQQAAGPPPIPAGAPSPPAMAQPQIPVGA